MSNAHTYPAPLPVPASPRPSPVPAVPPKPEILRGWIKTMNDAILVFEAARVGIVPRVTRRFHELEKRSIIQSGAILVFTEEESGIKRWTDPYVWSASRMQGNFLMYRERDDECGEADSPYRCSAMAPLTDEKDHRVDAELEHYILGSWNKGKGLKKNGLMKKTTSLTIGDTTYHLISYYYPSDVRSGLLQTPSSMPELARLEISTAITKSVSQVRQPQGANKVKRGRPSRSRTNKDANVPGLLVFDIPPIPRSTPITSVEVSPAQTHRLVRHPLVTPSGTITPTSWSSSRTRPYAIAAPPLSSSASPADIVHHLNFYHEDCTSETSHSPIIYDQTLYSIHGCSSQPYISDASEVVWDAPQASAMVSPECASSATYSYLSEAFHSHGMACAATCRHEVPQPDRADQQDVIRSWQPVIDEACLMAPSATGSRAMPDSATPSTAYYAGQMYY